MANEDSLEGWPITLETYQPEVLDNSQAETAARCPRLYLYEYGLRRGALGVNYPIGFGIAYHKYREVVETLMRDQALPLTDEIHEQGVVAALTNYVQPPSEHYYSYLTTTRLLRTLDMARERIRREQQAGAVEVTRTEDAFDLELPFFYCRECSATFVNTHDRCPECSSKDIAPCRHGGRMDQIIDWRGRQWVRDFKTTGRMGKTYPNQFDPNNQITGYVWAGEQLSGRSFEGTLIEVVYNTKNIGPEFHQFLSTRSAGQIEQWLGSMFMEHRFIREMWKEVDRLGYLAFPQRTHSCSDYGGCYFREACSASSAFELEQWLKNNTQYSEWDFTDPEKEESKV